MMGETMALDVEILADQIKRAFWGESWHGPAVREVLAGVSAEEAAAHPVAGAHSIWEVVLHIIGGYSLVLRRVRGERAQLAPAEEWPPVVDVSPDAWRKTQHALAAESATPERRAGLPRGAAFARAGLRVLGLHPIPRCASARPLPCRSDRCFQEGSRGIARGGLTRG